MVTGDGRTRREIPLPRRAREPGREPDQRGEPRDRRRLYEAGELLAMPIEAFLVCGGTGAGKTTLLSAALGAVAGHERIVCVEDAAELAPRHPHVVKLVARGANIEGVGQVTMRDLVRQALRMRPDRIVVGEVRGAEVVDLLTALNTGHDGGAGTVHANSAAEVPARLEALAGLGGLSRAALHSQLAAAVLSVTGIAVCKTVTALGLRVRNQRGTQCYL